MNILHIIDSDGLFGAEIVLLNIIDSLKKKSLNQILLSIGNKNVGTKSIEEEAQKRNIRYYSLRFKNGPNIFGALKICKLSKGLKIDLFHSHGYKSDILLSLLPQKIKKIPVISTIHGWTASTIFQKIWYYELLNAFMLRRLDMVVAVSPTIQNDWKIRLFNINLEVIPNGIACLSFPNKKSDSLSKEIQDFCGDKFSVLAIGRLSPEKGYHLLIDAIYKLNKTDDSFRLVIIGDGPERKRLSDQVDKFDLSEKIYFTGYQKDAHLFLPFFNLFVLSSLTEGLPITLLEALQAGIPILSTAVGAIPQVLDNGKIGELVAAGNSDALAEKILYIYRHQDIAIKKAKAARESALKNYTIEKTACLYLEKYQSLVNRKKPFN